MAKGISLVSRTIKWLTENGYTDVAKVERPYNIYSHTREDLWNLFDLICLKPCEVEIERYSYNGWVCVEPTAFSKYIGCLIQVCSKASYKKHLFKFQQSAVAKKLLQTPCIMLLITWHKVCKHNAEGKRLKTKGWECEITEIISEVLNANTK